MLSALDIVILGTATVTLTCIAVWLREEIIDWRSKRHHREHDRELRARRNHGRHDGWRDL